MKQNKKLKLFISYSHLDNRDENPYIEQFKKHIAPLKENGLLEDWYDREILPGEDYQKEIDNNLEDADIICLFISADFLSSSTCKKEKKKTLELRKKREISVIPIIISCCGWQDDEDILHLLALPTDGKPVTNFHDRNEAWHNVYIGLKKIIEEEIKIRQLKITEKFESFLQDTDILTKAHSQKEEVFLDDIFIYPELDKYDNLRGYKEKISSEELLKSLLDYSKIVIAGEDQSSKTTLCKMIFKDLRKKNFIPVYVSDKKTHFSGKIENKILQSFYKQYEGVDIIKIDQKRIVPIVDDFHFAKNKEKHIKILSEYSYCIIVVDDIFSLNTNDEKLISSFIYFKIKEFKPSLRYELIKKWVGLTDKKVIDICTTNNFYQNIDKTTELIDSTLGKIIGSGIMPAYPFFILSAIVTYETFATPLDQEITSQGYCYQAFIYFYLRKQGVRNDDIDIYINFLTELSFYFYKEKKYELSPDNFTFFMNSYSEKYNLPIKQRTLLKNVGQIVSVDSLNNYSFRYLYLYYFFVAKYLAEHIEDSGIRKEIKRIMDNLHVNENAYIAIFIAHHSKNTEILEEIKNNALCLFDKYEPATLTKDEVNFFDKQLDIIIKAVLPPTNMTPERERARRLKNKDKIEQSQKDVEQEEDIDKKDYLKIELRRAIKTVEVMGRIIKNRAGSLEKIKLEELFKEAMYVHLRALSSFFEVIKSEDEQKVIIDFISERLRKIIEKEKKKPSDEKLKKISKNIFWNLNFFVVYGIFNKIIHSLGSDNLTEIAKKFCDKVDTPASFLIKHGILMWYKKNLQISELSGRIDENDFSEIAKRAIKLMIVNHCSLHLINHKDRQQIKNVLGIPERKLLTIDSK
ncbi:MAG: toll/interleukin-1 receptor domain-containing protein [Candidatus Atribacteria bacterium]|nr:toll/interleukin-1 receptor domain-containing protein [Candidatus Atribacteria bacterium]